jgi:hypothetical protein
MAKVSPFQTDSEEYPMAHREVYHDNDPCYEGKKIFFPSTGRAVRAASRFARSALA